MSNEPIKFRMPPKLSLEEIEEIKETQEEFKDFVEKSQIVSPETMRRKITI